MATIADFFKEKSKRQLNSNLDYREKIRAHKLSVFLRTAAIFIAVIAVVAVSNFTYKNKSFTGISVASSIPMSVVTGATAVDLNGSVLIYSKDGASCMDSKGKAIWNESYEMQSPILAKCGGTVALGDYNGRNIYVANNTKILGTIKTNLPIRSLSVSENGVVAAVLDDSDVIRIYVYDGNTNTETPIVEAKATMNKSGYPISISLSPNGKIMMVSYFYVDSGNMKTSVSFYNFGEVGSNKTDNFVSGYDYAGSLIPYVKFMDNDSAFALGDDRMVLYSGDEIPGVKATALLDSEVLSIYHNSDYVGLVYLDAGGESQYRMDVYNVSGDKLSTVYFNTEYTDIIFNKDQIIIYGGDDCNIYTVRGAEKFKGKFDTSIGLMIPTSSMYRYIVVTGDSLETIELN